MVTGPPAATPAEYHGTSAKIVKVHQDVGLEISGRVIGSGNCADFNVWLLICRT